MSDFTINDGRIECNNCDFWVPDGMSYLLEDHDCDTTCDYITCDEPSDFGSDYCPDHSYDVRVLGERSTMSEKTIAQSIEDGIDDVLNGRIASKEEMKEAFNND